MIAREDRGPAYTIQIVNTIIIKTELMYDISGYLRFGKGLRPGAPLGDGLDVRVRAVWEGYFFPFGQFYVDVSCPQL